MIEHILYLFAWFMAIPTSGILFLTIISMLTSKESGDPWITFVSYVTCILSWIYIFVN